MDEPDDQDEIAIRALIAETYAAMSSGRPGTARYFAHPDIAIAGSGQRPTDRSSGRPSIGRRRTTVGTGCDGADADGWTWRYWGGSEPQAEPGS